MNFEWREVELQDVITINPSYTIKKGKEAKKVPMTVLEPFTRKISGYEITPFNSGTKFINGDTLVARITPCLENGKTAFVTILDEGEIAFGSTEFIVFRAKEGISDNKYVYYLSTSPAFRDMAIGSMTGTSGRQRAQADFISKWKFNIPDLKEQKCIAAILSALDDKIELNNAIIKNLEEIAQALFKRWFVDFEFPNANGEPYTSSGGEFEESELGVIPEGWNAGSMEDLGQVVGGATPSKKEERYYSESGISWITPKDLSNNRNQFISRGEVSITEEGFKNSSVKILPKGSVLFSSRAPIGYVAIAKNELTTNQGFKSVVPNKEFGTEFIYYLLKYITPSIESRASGSTFKEISGAEMKKVPVLIPDRNVVVKFNKVVKTLLKKVEQLEEEVANLIDIRDSLLPKLMSGEIRVPLDEEELMSNTE